MQLVRFLSFHKLIAWQEGVLFSLAVRTASIPFYAYFTPIFLAAFLVGTKWNI